LQYNYPFSPSGLLGFVQTQNPFSPKVMGNIPGGGGYYLNTPTQLNEQAYNLRSRRGGMSGGDNNSANQIKRTMM